MGTYQPIIGLEIHIQLKTASKMFCACANNADELKPNTNVCPICLGHPGVLPVVNEEAIQQALKLALALGCEIPRSSKFDRKHYFYPDLPKGYQISQYDEPLAIGGNLKYFVGPVKKHIRFERLHIEEDSGKLVHLETSQTTLIDFNRAGIPLAELVTKPDFENPKDARAFLQELRLICRLLDVSDADMEKGHLRCDANVSLRPDDETFAELKKIKRLKLENRLFWPKTEIKNLNSMKSVEDALNFEIKRQRSLWEKGTPPMDLATRGWDDGTKQTMEQRIKETQEDYRYLPEPDLPRLNVADKTLETIQALLPELPSNMRDRFEREYHLDATTRDILVQRPGVATFFEQVCMELNGWLESQEQDEETAMRESKKLYSTAAQWILTKLFEALAAKQLDFTSMKLDPENFAELLLLFKQGKLNSTTTMTLLLEMVATNADPGSLVAERMLGQVENEDELVPICELVIHENPEIAEGYRKGKTAVIQFLIGQVMKKSHGKAKPDLVKKILETLLR